MDRSMYGKVSPGTYHPYRLAVKDHSISPGYALLADLQNSINPGGGGRVSSPIGRTYSPSLRSQSPGSGLRPVSPALRPVSPARRGPSRSVSPPARSVSPPPRSVSPDRPRYSPDRPRYSPDRPRYSPSPSPSPSPGYGTLNGVRHTPQPRHNAGGLSELDLLLDDLSAATHTHGRGAPRPTVDSLLDQLSADLPRKDVSIREGPGSTPDKKTVTVVVTETSVTPAPYVTSVTPVTAYPTSATPAVTHQYHSATTRHLDHLMNDLAHFKVAQESTLECMLGSLRADMSRQGVSTPQKGCCSACEKPIVGQVITALGQTWHPEHFTCAHCTQELGTRNFFERDGRPYCEPDYHNLFSPRCAYCNGPILDKCVTALEKTWHTEHFFCAQCGQQFGEDGFHERDGKPYCRTDYFDMFAPKCGGCVKPICENYISALNAQWHPDCFVCRECGCSFVGGSFFTHEGVPYCETHYHGRRGSLCAGCHKPISGRCVTAMFRKFHPDHFVCAFCLKQLNKGTFKEHNDKPYCHTCFDKLFG